LFVAITLRRAKRKAGESLRRLLLFDLDGLDADLIPFHQIRVLAVAVGARFPILDGGIGALAAAAEARGFGHDDFQLASGHVLGAVLASPFPNVF